MCKIDEFNVVAGLKNEKADCGLIEVAKQRAVKKRQNLFIVQIYKIIEIQVLPDQNLPKLFLDAIRSDT